MRRCVTIGSLLLFSLAALVVNAVQIEGDLVSRSQLLHDLLADADHPITRKVIMAHEQEISCRPSPKRLLAVHYRAKTNTVSSLSDDRVVIAEEQNGSYRVLRVLESDAGVADGQPYSDTDFTTEFITIGGMQFLYVQNRFSGSGGAVQHDVYTISSDDKLSLIPFNEERRPKLIRAGEELRNGGFRFADNAFLFHAGIYKPEDPECCPSDGTYRAVFQLRGGFLQDANTLGFVPNFHFEVTREWREKP